MLPPDLAAFSFSLDRAGSDDAIAARTAMTVPSGRVVVSGAQRHALLTALAGRGLEVVAFDAVRGVLPAAAAAAEHAGVTARVSLFAADPRDFDVPGACDAAVLPSSAWRLLTHAAARTASLACFRRALRSGGTLLVDCDSLPGPAPEAETLLREGPGQQRWSWCRSSQPGAVRVACSAPGVAARSLDLHDLSPEATANALEAAGFRVASVTDADDGRPFSADSRRAWIVATRPA